jgi:hypothetical protein
MAPLDFTSIRKLTMNRITGNLAKYFKFCEGLHIPTQTPVRPSTLVAVIEKADFSARMITSSSDLKYQSRSSL